jgi:glycosyltransferase involved in cell wall biosynthesis
MPGAAANLHLLHGWGGGLERWARLFAGADRRRRNLALSSAGSRDAYGLELVLWDAATGEEMERWALQDAICEVAVRHPEHAAILRGLCARHGVEHLYVSSLIGHSLDALGLDLPTTLVHHDYFPFCPALNLFFGAPCRTCRAEHLDRCLAGNSYAELFRDNPTTYWLELRERYFELLDRARPAQVCPLPGVRDALARIDPRFARRPFAVVEHGIDGEPADAFGGALGPRLRVVHLGRVNRYKGAASLRALLPRLLPIADLTLLGSGPEGRDLAGPAGVEVIEEYRPEELAGRLAALRPDLALFLSAVPETYSFTLSEASLHAIPAVARRLGAFAERIEHGASGFLFGSEDECIALLSELARSREPLRQVSRRLRSQPPRTAAEMVDDYYRLRPALPSPGALG